MMNENSTKMSEQEFELKVRPRPSETVPLKIPVDTLQSLKEIAKDRDMSVEALLKFYIGQGLRQDISQKFSNRVL